MTDEYQQVVLNREKRPKRVLRKTHRCLVCLGEGHRPQTCQRILADENAERADAVFKRLVETGKKTGLWWHSPEEQRPTS